VAVLAAVREEERRPAEPAPEREPELALA
jgi:hypothetical protein